MRAAVIKDNTVVNVIIASDAALVKLETALNATLANVDEVDCGIGYTYDGTVFTAPATEDLGEVIDVLTGDAT